MGRDGNASFDGDIAMTFSLHAFSSSDTAFDVQAAALEDLRPHPTEAALTQLGHAIMTELLDVVGETALEDVQTILCESLIGAFHSAAELIRDATAEVYTTQTGEVWTAWRGSRRGTRLTAAQLEAKQAIRAVERRKAGEADPGGPVVAFRAAPFADSEADAHRIFDALNWAKAQWPDMALATTGAKGAERLAIRWAQQNGVTLVLAKVDFDRHGKAAPFRANDELLALEPACCLTLAQSLNRPRAERSHPFGPALNLAQQAHARGVRHVAIRAPVA
jgi:hypothetical protein